VTVGVDSRKTQIFLAVHRQTGVLGSWNLWQKPTFRDQGRPHGSSGGQVAHCLPHCLTASACILAQTAGLAFAMLTFSCARCVSPTRSNHGAPAQYEHSSIEETPVGTLGTRSVSNTHVEVEVRLRVAQVRV
jgi:hypothetical protein